MIDNDGGLISRPLRCVCGAPVTAVSATGITGTSYLYVCTEKCGWGNDVVPGRTLGRAEEEWDHAVNREMVHRAEQQAQVEQQAQQLISDTESDPLAQWAEHAEVYLESAARDKRQSSKTAAVAQALAIVRLCRVMQGGAK
jgi:hypothetical protein